MSASIVIAHSDSVFLESTSSALREAGYDVAAYADSMSALDALGNTRRVEVLITRVQFPSGQPHGVALGLTARAKRPDVAVLFTTRPEMVGHIDGVAEVLVPPATAADVVTKVGEILARSDGAGETTDNADAAFLARKVPPG